MHIVLLKGQVHLLHRTVNAHIFELKIFFFANEPAKHCNHKQWVLGARLPQTLSPALWPYQVRELESWRKCHWTRSVVITLKKHWIYFQLMHNWINWHFYINWVFTFKVHLHLKIKEVYFLSDWYTCDKLKYPSKLENKY